MYKPGKHLSQGSWASYPRSYQVRTYSETIFYFDYFLSFDGSTILKNSSISSKDKHLPCFNFRNQI